MIGDAIGSLFSGLGHAVGSLFGSQLDFLSGKSCNLLCGPTWDLTCYIENFCIKHLLKFCAVSFLFYIILVLLYLLYKLGVCQCLCRMSCKMMCGCFSAFFLAWEQGCDLLCRMLCSVKRRRRRQRLMDVEMNGGGSDHDSDMERRSFSYGGQRRFSSFRLRDHKRNNMRRSLRPRNHKVRVGVVSDSVYVTKRKHIKHGDVRVIRTSSYARRGLNHKSSKKKK